MTLPPITYGSLTQYFHNVALGHSGSGITAGQIASALTGLLGGSSTSRTSGSFNFGTSPIQQSIGASLSAARQSLSNANATAQRFDDVNAALTQVGQIAGSLAPSSTGSPYGDATTLPAAGTTTLPDTLQGNINRAQRAGGLSGPQQAQEQIAAQTRFSALRGQAEHLVDGLQRLQLSDPTRQRAFDNAIAGLRSALDDSATDPNRVRQLSFSGATSGSASAPGTFDASIQGNASGAGTPIGRASARVAVDRLGTAITAARTALAQDSATAHQQVTSAQGVVNQLTQFQTQANNNNLSFGGGTSSYSYSPVSLFQSAARNSLFPRGGLMNLYA